MGRPPVHAHVTAGRCMGIKQAEGWPVRFGMLAESQELSRDSEGAARLESHTDHDSRRWVEDFLLVPSLATLICTKGDELRKSAWKLAHLASLVQPPVCQAVKARFSVSEGF